jgi:molybdopterin converting factor small subunit
VRVSVRLNGPMAALLGPRRELDLADGALVSDLLRALADQAGITGAPGLAVSIGGTIVDATRPLAEGDQVAVLAPVAGG